ncbi:Predicted arabinose efflux permease, MFS family [Pseudomonas sp. NFACC23-1]|uniref:MFS transporter n=1 Tax=unclassified Pseudomonas TaxID=196821 RepID=UPI0008894AC3|nr:MULTISPECIES: MFS transporter [unclassified Pseudomonas]SDB53434.1 Predicted arabinose efflux permease, MFS family [Pseudomonas sp. NFACC17-2]SEJ73607.1 Predicted arabinose efflux permease, MFS family [Pseudomonas sp. NFACC23-1]SFW74096.1 Predicted arabinose efflux permease, MFS family [Pseudomonas sp. NFACC16-2]
MTNPYLILFRAPGAKAFSLAGFVARLPIPMTGIGIITMMSQLRGNYALAGTVSATFVLTYALMSPQISRLMDRYGQCKLLPLFAGISIVGILLLLSCTYWHKPDWTLFAAAVLAGFMPSMSAMVRARWTAIYRGTPHLQSAFALETVLDEVSFVAGPPVSVGLSVAVIPEAGPLAAAVLLGIGALALAALATTEPPVKSPEEVSKRTTSVFRLPDVRWLTWLMVAMGVIVGTVDIVSVAFAGQMGNPAAASIVLSCYAVSSCAAGLLFGALKLEIPLHKLLLWGSLATAATTLPLLLAVNIASLACAVLLAGLFFAPTTIVAMSLVERIVPERQLTEGMAWLLAGLNIGVAVGAAASGQLVDMEGARHGFTAALAAGTAVLLIAVCSYRRIRELPFATS